MQPEIVAPAILPTLRSCKAQEVFVDLGWESTGLRALDGIFIIIIAHCIPAWKSINSIRLKKDLLTPTVIHQT